MTSVKTQLPYEYYTLPFCQPQDGDVKYKSLNLGKKAYTHFDFMHEMCASIPVFDCNKLCAWMIVIS